MNRHVLEIRSLENNKWLVNSVDKPTGKKVTAEYDSVMICNGSYNSPYMPKLEGLEQFKGQIIHSHSYRKSDPFSGKRVLCVGGGSSGLDLTLFISNVADYVCNVTYHTSFHVIHLFADTIVSFSNNLTMSYMLGCFESP